MDAGFVEDWAGLLEVEREAHRFTREKAIFQRDRADQVIRERDEARAEVERLRETLRTALAAIQEEPCWSRAWAKEMEEVHKLYTARVSLTDPAERA